MVTRANQSWHVLNLQRIVQPPSEYHPHSSTILLLEALQISIGTKEKCAELEEAWNSCADTAELLKEEVAEAVHGYPPVSTNVLSLKSPHLVWWFSIIFLWKPFRSSITHVQPMVLEYESQHLPHKSPSFVGKYTIHGAPSFFRFFQPATCLIPRGELVQNLGSDCLQGLIGTIPAW